MQLAAIGAFAFQTAVPSSVAMIEAIHALRDVISLVSVGFPSNDDVGDISHFTQLLDAGASLGKVHQIEEFIQGSTVSLSPNDVDCLSGEIVFLLKLLHEHFGTN